MNWMKKLRDTSILVLVFIAAVIGFSYYTNKGNDNVRNSCIKIDIILTAGIQYDLKHMFPARCHSVS